MELTLTIQFLRLHEWDMGNGQCPDCYGNKPDLWTPHPCVPTKEHEGHQPNCKRAKALEELGEVVQYAVAFI